MMGQQLLMYESWESLEGILELQVLSSLHFFWLEDRKSVL